MNHLWDVPHPTPDHDAAFDRVNPDVYAAFVAEAEKVKRKNFEHYSARTIVHVLRHHSLVSDGDKQFKINDHVSPYLARRLMRERPEYKGFFELRRSREDAA